MIEDFDPEFTTVIPGTHTNGDGSTSSCFITVHIGKIGGGTVGRRYEGRWGYMVSTETGVIDSGDDLNSGMQITHSEAAALLLSFLSEDEDECRVAGITLTTCELCGAPINDGGMCIGDGHHREVNA